MITVDGWTLFAHPLLLDQLGRLTDAVARAGGPTSGSTNAKLLAMLRKLIFEIVPQDPSRSEYRQGDTLGAYRKHWFRAKFGNGRFRLFFRYDSRSRIIVYAWVNDEHSLRSYGAKTDAYRMFRKMLDAGNPPDDWAALLQAASAKPATARFETAVPKSR